jgi:hypothetical protein
MNDETYKTIVNEAYSSAMNNGHMTAAEKKEEGWESVYKYALASIPDAIEIAVENNGGGKMTYTQECKIEKELTGLIIGHC